MQAKYAEGQKVRILPLIGSQGKPDTQIQQYVNSTGTVVKAYCIFRDDLPDLIKMFEYQDVYCCDVRLDEDDTILPGIPEEALEPYTF